MATTLNMLLQLRRDNVFTSNYKLAAGEPGFEISTNTLKIGDGSKTWAELPIANKEQIDALIKVVDDKVAALNDTFATDAEVKAIKEALEASIQAINDEIETYGDIVTHNAAEFDAAGAAEAVAGDLSDYETSNDARVKAIEDELDTFGDIVTHNAAEFETAGAAAAAEGRINETLKGYYTKTEADAEFATPAEVIEEVNKALKEVSDADTIENITTLVNYVNENAADLAGLITEVYGTAEMTGDSRLDTVEGRLDDLEAVPAAGIEANDIAAWNGEIGAKALAQGVKDVVDTNKATWDLAGTAVQSATFEEFKNANTKAIGDAEAAAKSYTDTELADFNTETIAPIDARVKDLEENKAGYATTVEVATAKQEAIDAAKQYSDSLEHKNTTYTVAATTNALEFTVTPSEGDAQTIKLVAPTVDTGIMGVTAGTDIVVTPGDDGSVEVAHKAYTTGTIKDAAHDSATDPSFVTGIAIENGHVTGATVRNLAEVLNAMEFILVCGSSSAE